MGCKQTAKGPASHQPTARIPPTAGWKSPIRRQSIRTYRKQPTTHASDSSANEPKDPWDKQPKTTRHLVKTTKHLDKTTRHLDKTTKHLDKTTRHLDKTTKHLDKTAKHLGKTTKHLGKTTKHLDKTTKHLDKTTKHLDKTTKHFRSIQKSEPFSQTAPIPQRTNLLKFWELLPTGMARHH